MKKIALNFVILALSVLLAYLCLESIGNNEEYGTVLLKKIESVRLVQCVYLLVMLIVSHQTLI